MVMNWNEVEANCQSNFLKLLDGQSVIVEFLSEPERTKDAYGKTKYECKVMVDSKILDWSFTPMLLHDIGAVLGKPPSMIKQKVLVSRTGSKADDTRYAAKKA